MSEATRIEESLHHADHADDPAAQEQEQDDAAASSTDQHGSDDDAHHDHDHEHSHDDEHDNGHSHDEGNDHSHDDGHGHEQHDAEEDGHAHEHLFSHSTQRTLLPVATIVLGLGLGGLFGLAFTLLRPLRRTGGDWQASLQLGGVAWAVTVLAPTLTVPANPPGVGDAAGMETRTQVYLLTIGTALVAALALAGLARRLTRTSLTGPARQSLIAAATVALAAGLVALLPSALPGDGFPAELLWRFRLVSVASQTLLWAGIAVGVGLLWHRATAPRAREGGS